MVTSISYAWVNPGPYASAPQNGLDLTLVDSAGNELPGSMLINEDNVYPGWSKEYTLRVKNSGSDARYTVGADFVYDKSDGQPSLADVLSLKIVKNGTAVNYRLTDLIGKPLQDITIIKAGNTHTFPLVLSMDESAGNEYERLTLNVELTITAEPLYYDKHDDPYDGGNGGTKVVVTPQPTPTPTPTPTPVPVEAPVIIEDLPVPEGPLPDRGAEEDAVLPQTGGVPAVIIFGMGVLLILTGYCLRFMQKKAD